MIRAAISGIKDRIASIRDRFVSHRDKKHYDTERGQAVVRLVLVPPFFLYMIPAIMFTVEQSAIVTTFYVYSIAYIPFSVFLLYHIVRRPGAFAWRRIASMGGDYCAMTLALSAGGIVTLPVYAILLWVTVGNGLRFGTRYLVAATLAALATIAITTLLNDYWGGNLFLVITLAMTTVLVPAYIFALITRLHRANLAAQEANIAKSRFLAQASHDLRQPIHAISLFTACLHDSGLGPEEKQMVENIDRSLQGLSRLFQSLLDISTLDSGKVTPKMEAVPIGELIEEIVWQNSRGAEWADVTLRAVPSKCHVLADRALLTTIIQNIVTNALKYAPNRPVLVGCRRRGGKLAIEIHDCGNGIADEHLSHVFEEFYQVRERGDKDIEGVGLGLAIVQRLSHLMGLSIRIRSQKGTGTTVIIEGLQIVPAPSIKPASAIVRPQSMIEGLRVLLVEDDENVLLATAMLLEKWGCEVQAETTPPTDRINCDLLITDFDLGEKLTGTDCITSVRRLSGWEVPAIIMTGHDEARVQTDVADSNIPILSKPVRPAELRSVLTAQTLRRKNEAAD